MSRVYDRMMRFGSRLYDEDQPSRDVDRWVQAVMPDSTVFQINNVARYWAIAMDGNLLQTKDFPNLAPPMQKMWFEYEWPYATLEDNPVMQMIYDKANQEEYGPPVPSIALRSIAVHASAVDGYTNRGGVRSFLGPELYESIDAGAVRWALALTLYWEAVKGKPLAGPIAVSTMAVDPDGSPTIIRDGSMGVYTRLMGSEATNVYEDENEHGMATAYIMLMIDPVLLAISLLHCKNVNILTNEPPLKARQKHAKKHGQPLTTYKTLDIKPMKTVLERAAEAEATGIKNALHVCRAHFKTFGGDKKLFGKYEGTYFWEQQLRGSEKLGRIDKDYNVLAPDGDANAEVLTTTLEERSNRSIPHKTDNE